jgi:hypothetical protein
MKPTGDPQIHRRFQYTEFDENSNKEWTIKAWPLGGGQWHQRTEYCRTGYKPQVTEKQVTRRKLESLIRSKLRKGYREVDLAQGVVQAAFDLGCSHVTDIVTRYMRAANEYIDTYLQGTVDAVSEHQIGEARRILAEIGGIAPSSRTLVQMAEAYYRLIPTKLPSRIDPWEVAAALKNSLQEQEDRLQQVEAAKYKITTVEGTPKDSLGVIGAELEWEPDKDHVRPYLGSYMGRVRGLFRVHTPTERQAFTDCEIGNPMFLTHGTKSQNVRHILRTGLKRPVAARGLMFGSGIYFADDPNKSSGYIGGSPRTMLITEVRLGQVYEAPRDIRDLVSAPLGYDSVKGVKGKTLSWGGPGRLSYSEYVVYRTEQQTLRWLVVMS